ADHEIDLLGRTRPETAGMRPCRCQCVRIAAGRIALPAAGRRRSPGVLICRVPGATVRDCRAVLVDACSLTDVNVVERRFWAENQQLTLGRAGGCRSAISRKPPCGSGRPTDPV